MLAHDHRIAPRRGRRRRRKIAGEGHHDRFGVVFVQSREGFLERPRAEFGVALDNTLRSFGLSPQRAGEHGVKTNIAAGKVAAEKPSLCKADLRQTIIVLGTESRLTVAYDIDDTHLF